MPKPILIFGAQGRAKPALEIFNSNDLLVYGLLDDDPDLYQKVFYNVPVLGTLGDPKLLSLLKKECNYFIALADRKEHVYLLETLQKKYNLNPINAIHKQTSLPSHLRIGEGNFINTGVTIGADTLIHYHTTIDANAIIGHDVEIYEFVHIGAGAIIGSGVTIEPGAFIGPGAIILNDVRIGEGAVVAPGAIIES